MTRFRIEKGISRINRVKLQVLIEESVARDLALMCDWSNNDRNYVVNQLLRFALGQDAEFLAYKAAQANTVSDAETQAAVVQERSVAPSATKVQTRLSGPDSGV